MDSLCLASLWQTLAHGWMLYSYHQPSSQLDSRRQPPRKSMTHTMRQVSGNICDLTALWMLRSKRTSVLAVVVEPFSHLIKSFQEDAYW
ncbi:hypothetical protein BD769DRAFT_73682 [Suillus cothurnatus]|nr:hypothetical protein BD769DRAFT_73682 [Suillus cothurnatus]